MIIIYRSKKMYRNSRRMINSIFVAVTFGNWGDKIIGKGFIVLLIFFLDVFVILYVASRVVHKDYKQCFKMSNLSYTVFPLMWDVLTTNHVLNISKSEIECRKSEIKSTQNILRGRRKKEGGKEKE